MGTVIGIFIHGLMIVVWLGVLGTMGVMALEERGQQRVFGVLGSLLVITAFLSLLTPRGSQWLPGTVEWPVGWSGQVVTTPSGMHAVAHQNSGRIQVYDAGWRFVRGWSAASGGGMITRFEALPNDTIGIATARGPKWAVFDLQGRPVAQACVPQTPPPPNWSGQARSQWVPTWLWLLALTSAAIAFALVPLGMIFVFAGGSVPWQRSVPTRPPRGSA